MAKGKIDIEYDPALLDRATLMDEYMATQAAFFREQEDKNGMMTAKAARAIREMTRIKNLIVDHEKAKNAKNNKTTS